MKNFTVKNNGQISIYLCIILLEVISLAALLVDASRISAGDALVKKAVRSAAKSSLAEFSTTLKQNYGVFALSPEKCTEAETTVKKYLELNLEKPDGEGALELYDFQVEELEVTPLFNLSEDEVFRRQVLEYMKYRAPKELVDGFLDRLEIFKDTGKMSEAYKKKVAIDKMAGKLDKSQQSLKKKVDGSGAAGERFINGFNKDGCVKKAYDQFLQFNEQVKSIRAQISSIEASISSLQAELSTLGQDGKSEATPKSSAKDRKKELEDAITALISQKLGLSGQVSDIGKSSQTLLEEMKTGLTEPYINLNESAAENVSNIVDAGENILSMASELDNFLSANFGVSNPVISNFIKTATEDVSRLKGLLLSGEKAKSMLDTLGSNAATLQQLAGELQKVGDLSRNGLDPGQASEKINTLIQAYDNTVAYDYEKPVKGDKKDDPRSGKAEAVQQFLQESLLEDVNYLNSGFKAEELPSRLKFPSPDFSQQDEQYGSGGQQENTGEPAAGNIGPMGNTGEMGNFGEEVDLYDEEGMFQENALGSIGEIGKMLSGNLTALRDEIYIDEYIMGTFKNAVQTVGEGSETVEDKDFSGIAKKERNTFYEDEVEYILHGNASQNVNKALTSGQLLLVRFGLNTLHVYTDAKKKELATVTAAAVAGWWTGGAGIPVVSNLIMCGWSLGESLIDVRDLMQGKQVPIYKSAGDWKLDIGVSKEGPKADSRLSFSYHDYLRLFLLITDSTSKLGRMEDLIQLNRAKERPDFRVSDCKTAIRVEAVVSMKYLFVTQAFMPARMKTEEGRHKFKVLIYEGY